MTELGSIAAWVAAGLMFISSVGTSIYQVYKNGKSNEYWKGQTEQRLRSVETQHDKCRVEMGWSIKDINAKIADIHDRITHLQGAE